MKADKSPSKWALIIDVLIIGLALMLALALAYIVIAKLWINTFNHRCCF